MIDQDMPDVFICVEPVTQLQERKCRRIFDTVAKHLLPTANATLHTYGVVAYYSLASGQTPWDRDAKFDVYVAKTVNRGTLRWLIETYGYSRQRGEVNFIDGTYDEDGPTQPGKVLQLQDKHSH